jgi:hypothetical protein
MDDSFEQLVKDVLVHNPRGKDLLEYLVDYCMVYKNTFTGDAATTAFNEGVRSVGLKLLSAAAKDTSELIEAKIQKGSNPWLNKLQQSKNLQ